MRAGVWIAVCILCLHAGSALAQADSLRIDSESVQQTGTRKSILQNLEMSGYVKQLQTFILVRGLDSLLTDNLLHNRLNFTYAIDTSLSLVVEVRNRIFYGDLLRQVPQYPQLIDSGNDVWDLSAMPVRSRSLLVHTMLDRVYAEWTKNKLEVRLGRQRINWGLNLVWNPNDIFNAYSFFDFDYEERPGSDALRVRYFTGFAGGAEFAARLTTDPAKQTIAGLYKFNRSGYDIQFLGGVLGREAVAGLGWAGSIQDAGFKGEFTYLHPYQNPLHKSGQLLASVSADYSFASSLYLHASVLYNSRGEKNPEVLLFQAFRPGRLSVKDLSPYKYNVFAQASYPIHPLLNAGLATIYFPEDQALFLNPTLTYSAFPNLDLDAIGQFFLDSEQGEFKAVSKAVFVRLKWSF
ncbi:hypothetical protein [Pontibacter anaerobius]|uniref:Alginate export domain-containing protein n=1 Tax=Pontibacter anaerobius TaxID=2993940 RepID=A0ABT3RD92_9BACT|nr:hypothetical protein [Pontibacter anaerobius]MCX2739817.1 hypothetical protein [Pontibacter anaerobius]